MEAALSAYSWLLWAILLAVALFLPVRQLIWVLQVRRREARLREPLPDPERQTLKRRAGVTAGLLCFVFAVLYARYLFFVRA